MIYKFDSDAWNANDMRTFLQNLSVTDYFLDAMNFLYSNPEFPDQKKRYFEHHNERYFKGLKEYIRWDIPFMLLVKLVYLTFDRGEHKRILKKLSDQAICVTVNQREFLNKMNESFKNVYASTETETCKTENELFDHFCKEFNCDKNNRRNILD